MKFAILC